MPWRQVDAMTERFQFIRDARQRLATLEPVTRLRPTFAHEPRAAPPLVRAGDYRLEGTGAGGVLLGASAFGLVRTRAAVPTSQRPRPRIARARRWLSEVSVSP